MALNTFNWCFVGAGNIARSVAVEMTAIRSRSHKITAVYDKERMEATSFALFYGGLVYDSLEDAVMAPDVDAVYISEEDVELHYELAKKCLELNKPVLVEKPLTVNLESAKKLYELSAEKNIYLSSTTWEWFKPVFAKIREWIAEGYIGEVKKVDIKYAKPNNPLKPMSENTVGAIISVGTFPLTYCTNIFGVPDEISCKAEKNEKGMDISDKIILKYKEGFTCNIDVSLKNYSGREAATITGTDGIISVPLFHQYIRAKLMSNTKKETSRNFQKNVTSFDIVANEINSGMKVSEFLPPENVLNVIKIIDQCKNK